MELVEVKQKEVFCDSHLVAEKLKTKNAYIVDRIKRLIQNDQFPGEVIIEEDEYRGNKFEKYLLTVPQLIRLLMQIKHKNIKTYISELLPYSIDMIEKLFSAIENFDIDEDLPDRYIYAATDNQGNIKIGISKDPHRRVLELNTGNPHKLEIVFTKKTDQEKYSEETALHQKFNSHKLYGEWFYLPDFKGDAKSPLQGGKAWNL